MTGKTAVATWIETTIRRHRAALILGVLTFTLLYPLASQPALYGLALILACLLVPTEVCLIAFWASLSAARLVDRVGSAGLWLGGLYFGFVGAAAIHPQAVGRDFPLSLAIAMCALFGGTCFVAGMMRQYGWRLVQSPEELATLPAARSSSLQFHLADLLRWVTTLCVFLALGAATIPRFGDVNHSLHSYDPAVEAIAGSLCGSLCLAGPLGAIATGVLWLIVAVEDYRAAFRLAAYDPLTWIILLWSFIIAVILACSGEGGLAVVFFLLLTAIGFGGPMAAASFLLRGLGYRLKRLRHESSSAASPLSD